LPAAAAPLGGTVQPGARHQRRSENDGRDRRAAVYQRASGAHVLCAALGHPGRARGHRRRHPRRWVAACEDHGDADHQTADGGRLLLGSGRGDLHTGSVIRTRPRAEHSLDLRGNYGRGRDAADDRGLVGDVWAEWCGLCWMIAPIIEDLAVEYDGKAKVVKVDVDENPGVANRYGIMSIPTLGIFKGGEMVDRLVGYLPKPELKKRLEKILATAKVS